MLKMAYCLAIKTQQLMQTQHGCTTQKESNGKKTFCMLLFQWEVTENIPIVAGTGWYCCIASKAAASETVVPHGYQFTSCLVHLGSSSPLMAWEKQQMSQALGNPATHMGEADEVPGSCFGLEQSRLLQLSREWTSGWKTHLSPSLGTYFK